MHGNRDIESIRSNSNVIDETNTAAARDMDGFLTSFRMLVSKGGVAELFVPKASIICYALPEQD